jgi:predicted DNA-binding protein
LTGQGSAATLAEMTVNLKPETELELLALAKQTGRAPEDLVEDAMAGYLAELRGLRTMLDARYDELASGQVQAIDGTEAFRKLRAKNDAHQG